MGMYTGLRCKVIIKPEYRSAFEELANTQYEWSDSTLDLFKDFGDNVGRACFIPRGSLSYMPNEWERPTGRKHTFDSGFSYDIMEATHGFERRYYPETGLWTFQCSLKNYEDEIETFLDTVLSKIIDKAIHIETYYEEWPHSILHEYNGSEIVPLTEGIYYGERFDEDAHTFYPLFNMRNKDGIHHYVDYDYTKEQEYCIGNYVERRFENGV